MSNSLRDDDGIAQSVNDAAGRPGVWFGALGGSWEVQFEYEWKPRATGGWQHDLVYSHKHDSDVGFGSTPEKRTFAFGMSAVVGSCHDRCGQTSYFRSTWPWQTACAHRYINVWFYGTFYRVSGCSSNSPLNNQGFQQHDFTDSHWVNYKLRYINGSTNATNRFEVYVRDTHFSGLDHSPNLDYGNATARTRFCLGRTVNDYDGAVTNPPSGIQGADDQIKGKDITNNDMGFHSASAKGSIRSWSVTNEV